MLAGADEDDHAGRRLAVSVNIQLGDVAPAVDWSWQRPQQREVLNTADTVPTGAAPCTTVYWAGGLGTRSLRVKWPPVIVATNSATGLGLKTGSAGGSSNA